MGPVQYYQSPLLNDELAPLIISILVALLFILKEGIPVLVKLLKKRAELQVANEEQQSKKQTNEQTLVLEAQSFLQELAKDQVYRIQKLNEEYEEKISLLQEEVKKISIEKETSKSQLDNCIREMLTIKEEALKTKEEWISTREELTSTRSKVFASEELIKSLGFKVELLQKDLDKSKEQAKEQAKAYIEEKHKMENDIQVEKDKNVTLTKIIEDLTKELQLIRKRLDDEISLRVSLEKELLILKMKKEDTIDSNDKTDTQ